MQIVTIKNIERQELEFLEKNRIIMKILKENWLSILVIMALTALVAYFIIDNYFTKKVQFRAFEECVSVVNDSSSNWNTRKDTIKYCIEENF